MSTKPILNWDIAIVGGGMAGAKLVEELAGTAPELTVGVVCAEPHFGYNRVLLPTLLRGSCAREDLDFTGPTGNTQILTNTTVTQVDKEQRQLNLSNETTVGYQQLVLATGSAGALPTIPNLASHRTCTLRNLADLSNLNTQRSQHVVVVGGGLLGLEAADALHACGHTVHVVHRNNHLMNRQLDVHSATLLAEQLRAKGIGCELSCEITDAREEEQLKLQLSNGKLLSCDKVLFAVGNQPRTELARNAGLPCGRGVLTDAHGATADPHVFAIGECAQYQNKTPGLVETVNAQAKALAATLSGTPTEPEPPTYSTHLKVQGTQLFCCGDADPAACQVAEVSQPAQGLLRKLFFEDSFLKGAVFLGDTTGARSVCAHLDQSITTEIAEKLLIGHPL